MLVHEGGFTIDRHPDGTLLFLTPDGRPIEPVPTPPRIIDPSTLFIDNLSRDLEIHPRTNLSRWDGRSLDRETLSSAVCALLGRI